MNLKITFFLVFVFVINVLNAQQIKQTIKGKVYEEGTYSPMTGASIVVLGTNPVKATYSDTSGNFKLNGIPVGRYDIKISFIGYEPALINEILVSSGKEVNLNIALKLSATNLEEVKIKAYTQKDKPLNSMATLSARTFSVEEAQRYAGGLDDPALLSTSFAGVAGDLGQNSIVIRGNSPRSVLWKLEGVEISNPVHFSNLTVFGGGAFTALSSQMLSNSDFYTGAFPAEYGNALGGVFDLNLRTGNNDKYEHTVQIGGIGIDVSSEGPFAKGKSSSYLFNYRYSTLALIAPFLPEFAGNIRYQDLCFKLNFPSNKAGTFSFWGLVFTDKSGGDAKNDTTEWNFQQDKETSRSHQLTGVIGLSHKYNLDAKTFISSSLAATIDDMSYNVSQLDSQLRFHPTEQVLNNNWKFMLNSFVNHKFSNCHINKTGFNINLIGFDIISREADPETFIMNTYADYQGKSYLGQFFSESNITIAKNLVSNIGLRYVYFDLNKHYNIEPRAGIKWNFTTNQSISFAYGNHSQLEMLGLYLAEKQTSQGIVVPNKNLDFAKARHFILGYDLLLNDNLRLKVEPYFQLLYNIPVINDSSFSVINIEKNWYINNSLVNKGKGKNLGIDLTLERFLNNGYYYLITSSFFKSTYSGGDGIWRDTRYDKNIVINILGGKEWQVGRNKNNILSINGRYSFWGGDRISPVDAANSIIGKQIVYDENMAFANRKPATHYLAMTIMFRKNKPKYSSIWSLQFLNMLGSKEMYGYKINLKNNSIVPDQDVLMVPDISYKIEF